MIDINIINNNEYVKFIFILIFSINIFLVYAGPQRQGPNTGFFGNAYEFTETGTTYFDQNPKIIKIDN